MKNYLKHITAALLFTSFLALVSAQSVGFEYMQTEAGVQQGSDVDIEFGLFPESSSGGESTLELLVDKNGDGEYGDDDVVAETDLDINEYSELNLTFEDVGLEPGSYSYSARLENGSTYNYYDYGDGNLTVEGEADLEPAIEEIELEREQDGSVNVGDTFEVLMETDSEEVVSFESDVAFDESNVKMAGVEPVSSSFYAERHSNSDSGVETVNGQSEESVNSPEFAYVVFEAVEPGSSVISTKRSEIGTSQDTFTDVGEDEVEVTIEENNSEEVSVESIEAEIGESTVVEIDYEERNEEELELDETNKEAVIEEVAASTNLDYQKVEELIEFESGELEIEVEVEETTEVEIESSTNEDLNQEFELNFTDKEEIISSIVQRTGLERNRVEENIDFEREEEDVEVEIEVEIGDGAEVNMKSSARNDLNQEFELSSNDREEVVRSIIERTNLEENVVRKNIEFEKAPVDELGREALIRELKEARDSESSDLKEENERLKKENQRLKKENERLRERLDEEDTSVNSTSENEENQDTVSEGDDVEDEESRDTEVENTSEDEESQNESDNELTEEEVNFVQRLVSLFQ